MKEAQGLERDFFNEISFLSFIVSFSAMIISVTCGITQDVTSKYSDITLSSISILFFSLVLYLTLGAILKYYKKIGSKFNGTFAILLISLSVVGCAAISSLFYSSIRLLPMICPILISVLLAIKDNRE